MKNLDKVKLLPKKSYWAIKAALDAHTPSTKWGYFWRAHVANEPP